MSQKYIDIVYDLVNGTRIPQPDDPEVENLFEVGRDCAKLYSGVYAANLRLCERLGVQEDCDVEEIIDDLLKICELVGKRMYRYGTEFQHES